MITSAILSLLGEYSMANNWAKKAIGLYLYSTGSQRQPISVVSHLGLSESYTTITGRQRQAKRKTSVPTKPEFTRGGSLRQLSESMVDMARVVASQGLFGTSYDNINMVFGAAEQLVGRTGQFVHCIYRNGFLTSTVRCSRKRYMLDNLAPV